MHEYMHGCMEACEDRCMDGYMHAWMYGSHGCMGVWMHGYMISVVNWSTLGFYCGVLGLPGSVLEIYHSSLKKVSILAKNEMAQKKSDL